MKIRYKQPNYYPVKEFFLVLEYKLLELILSKDKETS